ncbi:hypothetical protein BX661DRAFT_198016 [Kickxella alabastrina]|uniref:uncharacterized protein n=1 Tax=Kickxella alabastrina TaxID=61397 RepID=UPI00221FF8B8|nr:uncharacterized protein BX661DRAFT_198016 [Kickxella alabastrina]KAI7829240.1 hypothetical protein BX661DRAFT_198016 [Kickxella alabastrina]
MASSPIPANIRKRSDKYANNIKHRGSVPKSLDAKVQQKLEARRLSKKGLGTGMPVPTAANGRRILLALLLLTVGSALYQVCLPLFGSQPSSGGQQPKAKQSTSVLTREQQAKAAQAVLQELNPPVAPQMRDVGVDDFEDEIRKLIVQDDDELPHVVAEAQGPLV